MSRLGTATALAALGACAAACGLSSTGGAPGPTGSGGASSSAAQGGGGANPTLTGSGGGGGPATECTPGETQTCYGGPTMTEGVGACKSGTQTCKGDGTWSVCVGQVVPQAEICATAVDDDCDGMVNEDGPDCTCTNGETVDCYSGPMGTIGVGTCAGGKQVCKADGTGFEPDCIGEIVPAYDDCYTAEDEDCDGATPLCTGEGLAAVVDMDGNTEADDDLVYGVAYMSGGTIASAGAIDGSANGYWLGGGADGRLLGTTQDGQTQIFNHKEAGIGVQGGRAAANGPSGEVYFAGEFDSTTSIGPIALSSAGLRDAFVARVEKDGTVAWARSFGGTGDEAAHGVAFGPSGVAVVGKISSQVDFGNGPAPWGGAVDVFVVLLDPATGQTIWAKTAGDAANQEAWAVAIGPDGGVVVVGEEEGKLDFGGGGLQAMGLADIFVQKLDAAGAPLWGMRAGDNGLQQAFACDVAQNGDVVVAGQFQGTADLGKGKLTSAGGSDVFVGRFAAGGTTLWEKAYGDAQDQFARGVAFNPAGNVVVAGWFRGSLDFGGTVITNADGSNATSDAFVAKLSGADPPGEIWAKAFGDAAGSQIAYAVAVNRKGNIAVGGAYESALDFGGPQVLQSKGGFDGFVFTLAP